MKPIIGIIKLIGIYPVDLDDTFSIVTALGYNNGHCYNYDLYELRYFFTLNGFYDKLTICASVFEDNTLGNYSVHYADESANDFIKANEERIKRLITKFVNEN